MFIPISFEKAISPFDNSINDGVSPGKIIGIFCSAFNVCEFSIVIYLSFSSFSEVINNILPIFIIEIGV